MASKQMLDDSVAKAVAPKAHEGYRISIEPSPNRISIVFDGQVIAVSILVLVMRETRLSPTYYFPRKDVKMDLLSPTDQRTHCPFKGNANYWSVGVGSRTAANAAWSYEDAFDEVSIVRDYIAFYWEQMDEWIVDDEPQVEPPPVESAHEENSLVEWLVHEAWMANSTVDQVTALASALVASGFPLFSLRLFIRTLHPQLFARFYSWKNDGTPVVEREGTHEVAQSDQYRDSPFALVINGQGGVRRRLDGDNPKLDFPILIDLLEEGATDYVAVPLKFSTGQINVLTIVSDAQGGFSTDQLGYLYEILPNLGRLLEAHVQRNSSLTLLQTYLGRNAGQRVDGGLIQRGDGEELHAVIWFSDLRQSTKLAETLSRQEYLAVLNQYFDCVAGAVIHEGGEVLKFIGDAVLAIFPIDDPQASRPDACAKALAAVRRAHDDTKLVNQQRQEVGQDPLKFGIGLHRGTITYGNVGTERRLDFTVIGPAVNEAARIEDLCKTLDKPILMSSSFANGAPGVFVSLGDHLLRGVQGSREIFTIANSKGRGLSDRSHVA